jgi:hypothetical protein
MRLYDISQILMNNSPRIHLMFTPKSTYESTMPGFFTIPLKFEINELEEFVKEKLVEHS